MKEKTIKGFVPPHQLARCAPSTPVLLALSGGADSRALLHLLCVASREYGFPLYLAHVNHGIRGEEADRDQAFCEALAKEYGLEIFVQRVDVPSLAAAQKKGLEEVGREVRYAFFASLMEQHGIGLLATAHHADDNLETLLFRLCRGSGTRGLSGILPARAFSVGQVVRPLLRVTRNEILDFCARERLTFVTDSTNADTVYLRNRLRADVIPVLQELFVDPQVKSTEAASSVWEDDAYLCELSDALYQKACVEDGLSKSVLAQAPVPLCKRVLARWVEEKTGAATDRLHLQAMLSLIGEVHSAAQVALQGDCCVIAERGLLRLIKRCRTAKPMGELPFEAGSFTTPDGTASVTVERILPDTKVHNLYTESYIILKKESAIISNGLHWRLSKEGETLLLGGMHQKLKKRYGAADIPPLRRRMIPMLCDEAGIVWAPFAGIRDGVPSQKDGMDKQDGYLITVRLLSFP